MPPLHRLALQCLLAAGALVPAEACAQPSPSSETRFASDTAPPPVQREMRAVWVATVGNMDWPSRKGLSTAQQQAELVAIFDRMSQLHMNAMVLQVRPAADALYSSPLEPWSDFLTGTMGRAPEPYYDPLTFAIGEAHKRGIELHVWINPYRAKDPSTKALSANHVSRTNPELVREYGPFLWLDPGDPRVRALTTNVVLDLVRRYDIDAVHMDDYFYPYPEARRGREMEFPDDATWQRYRREGGPLARDDWRRENVNLLVKGLYEGIHATKPWVRFGVSPFGIWRPGYPSSVRGLDQYARLYADARKWLQEGWVDYFTPQLYWAIDRPQQSYVELLRWWTEQNVKGRNIWPGNYTGKVAFTNAQKWRPDEIINQIRLTRAQPGATGNVHFSSSVFMQDPDRLDERLLREVYAAPALVPASPWLDRSIPPRPVLTLRTEPLSGDRVIDLQSGTDAPPTPGVTSSTTVPPTLWVVQTRTDTGWTTAILPGIQRTHLLAARGASLPWDVRVTAIDRVGNASPAARINPRA
ncbi:MAG: hypothetical protein JWN53_1743 [Gemmatimonadetes bacterium]|nr:hypothetical protein [Gemmatimonadota bacterium]